MKTELLNSPRSIYVGDFNLDDSFIRLMRQGTHFIAVCIPNESEPLVAVRFLRRQRSSVNGSKMEELDESELLELAAVRSRPLRFT